MDRDRELPSPYVSQQATYFFQKALFASFSIPSDVQKGSIHLCRQILLLVFLLSTLDKWDNFWCLHFSKTFFELFHHHNRLISHDSNRRSYELRNKPHQIGHLLIVFCVTLWELGIIDNENSDIGYNIGRKILFLEINSYRCVIPIYELSIFEIKGMLNFTSMTMENPMAIFAFCVAVPTFLKGAS